MLMQIILFVSTFSFICSSLAPTQLMVTRAGPCYDDAKTTVSVSELTLLTHTYDSLVSGELNITEDISNGWKMKATMQKCVDVRNTDSCDFFRSFDVVTNGCSDEDEDDEQEIYGMLFHYATPEMECPLQAGQYKILNYPLFNEDNFLTVHESKISTSIFGYTFKLDGYTVDNRKIFCVEAYLQLLYIREHDWIQKIDIQRTTLAPHVSEEDNNTQ